MRKLVFHFDPMMNWTENGIIKQTLPSVFGTDRIYTKFVRGSHLTYCDERTPQFMIRHCQDDI